MSIQVKIIRMPALFRDLTLADGATVEDALKAADIQVDPVEQITVNGNSTTTAALLTDQARVVLARGAKGNK